ncbi:MAG: mechanosensitive ion channel family protein [Gammaproteobacteria bacterium]|nr:mechanosensitive ion channel family protein [Gammaproteobacteria bacterium]
METVNTYIQTHSWIAQVFLIVLATATARFIAKIFFNRLRRQFEKTHNLYDDALLAAIRPPVTMAIWVVGISFAAEVVGKESQAEIFTYVTTLREVAVVWLLIWFLLRFIRYVETHVIERGYRKQPIDQTTASAVGKLLRASVIITGVLLVLQAFGFSISGVLAFGGIGGIAIGFAARDMLANFFGAMMIFLDRPFSVGDWIRSPDREIEGTVEEIGWRVTRIRTFDKRPLYLPNSIFTSLAVENPSRMQNRRINETIGLRYDDFGVLEDIVSDVESMLRSHDAIDTDQTLMVNLVSFGPSSVDFFIYCFTKTTVWTEFHVIKQDVLLKIGHIIESHNAEIAFPTQTLHIQPEPGLEPT